MASFGLIGLAGGLAPAAVLAGAGGALTFSQLTKYMDWIYRQETALAELRAQEAAAIGRAIHDAHRGHPGEPLAGLSDVVGTAAGLAGRVGEWAADTAPEPPPDQPTPRQQRRRRLVRRAGMVIGPVVLALSLRGDAVQPPRPVLQPPRPEVAESVEPGPSESPDTPVEVEPESEPPASEPPAGSEAPPPRVYEVVEGDRMWDIAGRFLGDPLRYPEIAAENPQLADRYPGFPDHIRPGDLVNLPTGATDRGPQRHATGAARPDPASAVQETAETASAGTADPAVTVDGAGRTPDDPAGPGAVPPDGQPDLSQPPAPTAAALDLAPGSGADPPAPTTTVPGPVPGTVPDGTRSTQHRPAGPRPGPTGDGDSRAGQARRRRLAGGSDDPPAGDRPPPGRRHLHAVPDAGDAGSGSGGPAPPAPPGGPGDGGSGPGVTPELVAELAGALATDPAGTGARDAAAELAAHLAELVRDPDLTGLDLRRVTGRFAELLGALRAEARARQDLFDHLVRVVGLSPVRAHGVAAAASYDERGIAASGLDPFERTASALVEAGVAGDVSTAWSEVGADPPLARRLAALVQASYLRAAEQTGLEQLGPTGTGELAWHGPGSAERAAGTAGVVARRLGQWVMARLVADQAEYALVAQLSAGLHADRAVAAARQAVSELAARLDPVEELTRIVLAAIPGQLPADSPLGQPPYRDLSVELVARRAQVAGRQAALAREVAGLPGGAVLARPGIVLPGLQDAVRLPVFHRPEPVDLDQWERAAAGIRWQRLTDGAVTVRVSGRRIVLTITPGAGGRRELAFELVLDPAATSVTVHRQDGTRYALRVPGRADLRDLPLLLLSGLAEPALLGNRQQVLGQYLFDQVEAAVARLGQDADGPSRLARARYHEARWIGELFRHELAALRLEHHPGSTGGPDPDPSGNGPDPDPSGNGPDPGPAGPAPVPGSGRPGGAPGGGAGDVPPVVGHTVPEPGDNRVLGRPILRDVLAAYEPYREAIAATGQRVVIIRFEPAPGSSSEWAQRMEASRISAEQKVANFTTLGLQATHLVLPGDVSHGRFADVVGEWNADSGTAAIIVQLPTGPRLRQVVSLIEPAKDIDGLLGDRSPQSAPATAEGIWRITEPFTGDRPTVAVVGSNGFIGSGVVTLLRRHGIDPISLDLGSDLRQVRDADIVISVTGSPGTLGPEHLLPGHRLVVDGSFVPRPGGEVRGDVRPDAVGIPQHITPVPGGIGPVEMAVLMERGVRAVVAPGLPAWRYAGRPYSSPGSPGKP
jgi:methylenetetrahydrofolate dehydrogenase (NADP+)/methenyltetrahydrofolate cyclohydrolase